MKFVMLILVSSLFLVSCSSHRPITATSNKVGDVKGESCSRNILFLIPLTNNESIYHAAKDGGITEISTVDRETFVSIIYNSFCTVVHGNK
jgi:PBP1b-binding outer membrane lipoprotein LpoB